MVFKLKIKYVTMVYCIIIRGSLGIGKTIVAKKLAKSLGGEYISIDSLLAKNWLDKIDKKEGCIPAKNFIKAEKMVVPKVKSILKKGGIVVFDGNFYHKKEIHNLVGDLKGYKFYVFTLKAPLNVCIERDSKRKNTYGKANVKDVYDLVSRFDYGTRIYTENKKVTETTKDIQCLLDKNYKISE